MDIATTLAVANGLTKAVIATFSPQFAKSVKSGLASLLIALFFAVAALATGYALYVVIVKYAATGNGGTISNDVRLGVCLLTVFAGLSLFYLRKRLRILYGLLEFG